MTWIVRVALERPLTFIVLALLILIFGPIAAVRTPTDIFPAINIPVIGSAFSFANMSSQEMSNRILTNYERFLTTVVDNVEHLEGQSMPGVGIEKIYFQPGTDIPMAMAQLTAAAQGSIRQAPAGTQPPLIVVYNAATVPVLQLAYSGKGLSEQQLLDTAKTSCGRAWPRSAGPRFPRPLAARTARWCWTWIRWRCRRTACRPRTCRPRSPTKL